MVAVRVNGEDSQINPEGLPRMADLVELVKGWIDPDHMITSILVDGRELDDRDWTASLSTFETSILEVNTDTPQAFVSDRISKSSEIIRACYYEFRDARKFFQDGDQVAGNRGMVTAVNTLQAFFEWYGTILELVPTEERGQYDISEPVAEISEICKKICQQQLYQSWWALGEALEKELEPRLDQLEDHLRKMKLAA